MCIQPAKWISVHLQAPTRRRLPTVARTIIVTTRSNAQQRVSHRYLPIRRLCVTAQTTGSHNAERHGAPALSPHQGRHWPATRRAGTKDEELQTLSPNIPPWTNKMHGHQPFPPPGLLCPPPSSNKHITRPSSAVGPQSRASPPPGLAQWQAVLDPAAAGPLAPAPSAAPGWPRKTAAYAASGPRNPGGWSPMPADQPSRADTCGQDAPPTRGGASGRE